MKLLHRIIPVMHPEDVGRHRRINDTAWEWVKSLLCYVTAVLAGGIVAYFVLLVTLTLWVGGADAVRNLPFSPYPPISEKGPYEGGYGEWHHPDYPYWQLPYCKTEDSDDCFYDAPNRGNGVGQRFYNLDGETYYLN